jgi:hypothetical protein
MIITQMAIFKVHYTYNYCGRKFLTYIELGSASWKYTQRPVAEQRVVPYGSWTGYRSFTPV